MERRVHLKVQQVLVVDVLAVHRSVELAGLGVCGIGILALGSLSMTERDVVRHAAGAGALSERRVLDLPRRVNLKISSH